MKFLLVFTIGILAVACEEVDDLKQFQDGNIKFTADIYQQVINANEGNILMCPLSLEIVLALVHAGAKGETAKELSNGLHFPEDSKNIQQMISKVASTLQVDAEYLLTSFNKIYVADGIKIKNDFKNIANNVFRSDILNLDFSQKEAATQKINQWVEEATHNKIKDLITEDCLNELTVAILINTMYFSGNWTTQFDSRQTSPEPFFINKTETVDVPMMNTQDSFNIYESKELDAQFLEMPYKGDDVSMTIVLPNEIDGLDNLEKRIADVLVRPPFERHEVIVGIPKFQVESTIKFKPILKAIGIKNAFSPFADFSEMVDNSDAHLTDVIQKTFIEVTETGTTAGVASTSMLGSRMIVLHRFNADHPFIYILRHKTNGIFFIGKYCNP